jgi:hypothetical protein
LIGAGPKLNSLRFKERKPEPIYDDALMLSSGYLAFCTEHLETATFENKTFCPGAGHRAFPDLPFSFPVLPVGGA